MKVIQVNASYKPAFVYGGPTMSVSKLSEVLTSKGLILEVLTTNANGVSELNVTLEEPVVVDNVLVTYYKRLSKDHTHFSPGLYIGLWKRIKESRERGGVLMIHIHTWWNLVSVISCLIAVFSKTPVVLSPRGTLSRYSFGNKNHFIKSLIFWLSKPLLHRCHLHVTSENEKRQILTLIQPKSIRVIPNLVDLPSLHSTLPGKKKEYAAVVKLLFLSRIEEKKGLELLFSVLARVDLNVHLNIAGGGDAKYIKQLHALSYSLKINNKISWLGHQSGDKKFNLMADHDLLILPSYDENFANVIIESLATGTAVLVTKNVGLSDYVEKKKFGWVCDFDPKDLSEKLVLACKEDEFRKEIRERAPITIRKDFSDDLLAQQYAEMYSNIFD